MLRVSLNHRGSTAIAQPGKIAADLEKTAKTAAQVAANKLKYGNVNPFEVLRRIHNVNLHPAPAKSYAEKCGPKFK